MSGNINAVIVIIILFSHNLTNEWSEQLTMQYVCVYVLVQKDDCAFFHATKILLYAF